MTYTRSDKSVAISNEWTCRVTLRNTEGFYRKERDEEIRYERVAATCLPRYSRLTSEGEINTLAIRWLNKTRLLSSVTEMVAQPEYQQIIALGRIAIPYLIERLRNAPEHWFPALRAITGENPVPAEDAGRVSKMRVFWLEWADQNGYGR